MTYPQAPWTLQGFGLQTAHLVDIDKARPFIPPEFDIISVWPGKTLGIVYLVRYQAGSTLEYSELIVAPAAISYQGKIGSWISHIYVDNSDSLAGGREIWGLPKEMADFAWQPGEPCPSVAVSQGDRLLCKLNCQHALLPLGTGVQLPVSGTFFSILNNNIISFPGHFKLRAKVISGNLQVPPESPFSSLDLGQPWLSVYDDELFLVAAAPEVIGQRVMAYSYS